MTNRMQTAGLALALALAAGAAWAKLPPPPPMDDAAKAAAAEKKEAAAAKSKAELEAAYERTVQNYQANMKKTGKTVAQPPANGKAAPAPAPKK